MRGAIEGIVDVVSRRAITRAVDTDGGGLLRRVVERGGRDASPIYVLFDGTSISGCLLGRWQKPRASLPSSLPRGPAGLRLLDLIRPESVVDVVEEREDEVRGQPTACCRLRLDVGRVSWPSLDSTARGRSAVPFLTGLKNVALGDPIPKGIIEAAVWIDRNGRIVRYSHNDAPIDHPKHAKTPWITTELWDFGIPQLLSDWKNQPVIDPLTLEFPQSEAELIEMAKSGPNAAQG